MDKNTHESTAPVECPDKRIDEREEQIMNILAEMAEEKALDAQIDESFQKDEEQYRVHEAELREYEEADEQIRELEAIEEARKEEAKNGDELINKTLGL